MTNCSKTWLPTQEAAKALGLKPETLKRYYGHPRTGFLREGKHWKPGLYPNSTKGWCIEECREELAAKGFVFFSKLEVLASSEASTFAQRR